MVSIDTGHIAQSPQSGPRWSPAFQIEPVLFPPSSGIINHPSLDCNHPLSVIFAHFSHIFLILSQYIVVFPVPQDLSRSKASTCREGVL